MQQFQSPIGWLSLAEQAGSLIDISFNSKQKKSDKTATAVEQQALKQLEDYFLNRSKKFKVPLSLHGTEFQQRVWRALQEIPYGQVKTYGQLASELNSSPRAVGNACRANPVPIIVPCHRVVAANGIGGFAGKTSGAVLERKRWLLIHEGIQY